MTDLNLDEIDFSKNNFNTENNHGDIEVLDGNHPNEGFNTSDNSSTKQGSTISDSSRVAQIKSEDVIKPDVYEPGNTLKEPIVHTFMRDIMRIYNKTKSVLKIKRDENEEKQNNDYDLWGPFLLCLLLSITISFDYKTESKGDVFVQVFTIFWLGAYIISLNNKKLGVNTNLFQCICYLGYSMFPLNVITIIFIFIKLPFIIKFLIVFVMASWSVRSAFMFICSKATKENKIIVTYPICLFYSFIGWYVLTASI